MPSLALTCGEMAECELDIDRDLALFLKIEPVDLLEPLLVVLSCALGDGCTSSISITYRVKTHG
jgi:hypothetical protein